MIGLKMGFKNRSTLKYSPHITVPHNFRLIEVFSEKTNRQYFVITKQFILRQKVSIYIQYLL